MSDLYLIPKTCTRTCSIIRISGVCGRSFLKIDVGVGVGIPRGPRQSGLVTVVAVWLECVWGRPMRVDVDSIVERGLWESYASTLVVETFAAQTCVVPHHPFLGTKSIFLVMNLDLPAV